MTEMLRGLVVLLAVASALVQVADAKSCKDDLDCPVKLCCTGNSSRAGVCSPLFVNGKQVCPSCKSLPGRQLACPKEASVCCGDGTCQKTVSDCQCSSDAQCPLHTCCTGTLNKPGHCSPQAYVKGQYVCQDCQSRVQGVSGGGVTSCPKDASFCCADGTCAKTVEGCKCQYTQACPSGSCCTSNGAALGVCTTQRVVKGKQTCPYCGSAKINGAPCPKEASFCCADGTCAKSVEGCPCSGQAECDESSCCTGDAARPGRCSKSAFVGGKQVCKDCRAFGTGAAQKCPKSLSVCCGDGTCHSSAAKCGLCKSIRDCPKGSCCTGDSAKPGKCVAQAFVNGKQVCKGCGKFGGKSLACPKDKSHCCSRDNSCRATLEGCPCLFTFDDYGLPNEDCPSGSCCTGSDTVEGVCSSSVFKNGTQVCSECNVLGDLGLACPASAPVCCPDGACKATAAGCSCSGNYDCPDSVSCCTATEGGPLGRCSASLFVKGKRACPACVLDGKGAQACPKDAPVCCGDGSCKSKLSLCSCFDSYTCPEGSCCAGFTHNKKGTCVPTPFVNGKQVCPSCQDFDQKGLSCPPGASFCCKDGTCQASLESCKCTIDGQCTYGSCCSAKGTCSSQPFIKGVQVCSNCTSFGTRNLYCPSTATNCCADGVCRAKC